MLKKKLHLSNAPPGRHTTMTATKTGTTNTTSASGLALNDTTGAANIATG